MCKLFLLINWNSIFSALTGGLIAGYFSLRAVDKAEMKDSKKREEEEKSLLRSFLLSIRDEVDTLWNRYMWGMGERLESLPENSPLLVYYPVAQNYFVVYDGNSSLIGKIKDDSLRKLIIITYTQAKGLLDSYKMNNELVQKFENFSIAAHNNSMFNSQAEAVRAGLVTYVKGIKEQHYEIKKNVAELIEKINQIR